MNQYQQMNLHLRLISFANKILHLIVIAYKMVVGTQLIFKPYE